MSKKSRIWYPGALYHITTRGNNKNDIFRDEEDYHKFLSFIKYTQERYPFFLYSYCLMSNHVHLQVQSEESKIWDIMRCLKWHYTKYFNNKYEMVGHLFQGRYSAELIEDAAYLLQTSKYIHLNPVKANIVDKPNLYPFSSYQVYLGVTSSEMVSVDKVLKFFRYNADLYKNFVEVTPFTDDNKILGELHIEDSDTLIV